MHFLSFIIWSPNPEILPNVDWIPVRWYGLLFAFGFIISQQLMYRIFKAEGKPVNDVDSLTLFMIVATVIGARLGHVLFYEPMRYLQDPISIIKTWEGGLASHGAAIGIMVGIYLYINYLVDIRPFKGRFVWKKRKRLGQSFLWVIDRIVICGAITGAFIRFGNFLNSEIIGIPTGSSHGVVFARDVIDRLEGYLPHEIDNITIEKSKSTEADENGYVPVSMIIDFNPKIQSEKSVNLITNNDVKRLLSNDKYITPHIYEPQEQPLDFNVEKSHGQYIARINTKGIPRYPAQLYESISSLLIFFFLLYVWSRKKGKTPEGKIFGIFLVVLFGFRFLYEFIKENQVDFEQGMTLNMGQILSIPLIIIGILILLNLKRLQPKNPENKK